MLWGLMVLACLLVERYNFMLFGGIGLGDGFGFGFMRFEDASLEFRVEI